MPVNAHPGDYDTKVLIYRPADTPTINPDGQVLPPAAGKEVLFCRRWASVKPVSASADHKLDKPQTNVRYVVQMHNDGHTRQIVPEMWLVLPDGKRLDIISAIDVDGMNQEMELECERLMENQD